VQLGKVERIRLGEYPTPVGELPNLSRKLGVRLLIKRDDLVGMALGGNKARKLEYALAEARAAGATAIVTSGAVQSNHVRLTVACANRLGLRTVAVLRGHRPEVPTGNLLLDQVLGVAEVRWVDPGRYGSPEDLARATDALVQEAAAELRARGEVPYVIPNGCSPVHSSLAYAGCVLELLNQLRERDLAPDAVVTACGTGGTQAGLVVGSWLYTGGELRVVGISVARPAGTMRDRILRYLDEVQRFLGLDLRIPAEAVEVHDGFIGPGYAVPTPEMRDALLRVAREEGILLDPVYTGKAMAGVLDLARRGRWSGGEVVVFLHTGGVPALFADTQAPAFHAPDLTGGEEGVSFVS